MTTKLLANQFRGILSDPIEGFTVELQDEASLFEWKVYIEGPRETPYEGGVFQLLLSFPKDYPMSPPVLKFLSDFWHPNVYHDGKVCMSILHPPGDDAMSGELAQERWLPTQSVTTIVLSLQSLLNDPNCSSPANVDASVEWRKNRESYIAKCKKLVEKANREKPAHVEIPHPDTNEEEHKRVVQKWKEMNSEMGHEDFYEDEVRNSHSGEESDDENESEFLESNEGMNTDDEGEEEEKEEEEKQKKEDKGKAPELASTSSSESGRGSQKESTPNIPPPGPAVSTTITASTHPDPSPSSDVQMDKANSLSNNPASSSQSSLPFTNSSSASPSPSHVSISNDDVINSSASSASGEGGQPVVEKRKKAKGGKKKKCIVM